MALKRLENRAARRVFLDRHALAEAPQGPATGPDLLDLIERLGFVQLDSINTLARAHDMILFSRRPSYRPRALERLHQADRAVFEHWTHDAAVIPMRFYPHWQLRFRRDADQLKTRYADWHKNDFHTRFDDVLAHIRDHGPVSSSDVGTDERRSSGGWWDWHPSKTALEYLWRAGALTVVGRENFQKRYDLTERVIEASLCDPARCPDPAETIDWKCNAALDRLGFATSGEIAAFWATVTPAEAKAWCAAERAAGRIEEIEVESVDGSLRRSFARPGLDPAQSPEPTGRIRVLSPFDPALRDRRRAERLFGFHYRIEVFTPAPQRKYGYYVLPLMERDRLIGRIDMKAEREAGVLAVRAMWPEADIRWSQARTRRLMAELERVARFAGLDDIRFDKDWLRVSA
ncbi:MAG: winged helix-turn-helix domain-containing protein [Rhodobacteraceae bacterium]|nr:MAG: winged helix-turn-helix domain-containing protein [Paracoccaceae bacterium]